MRQLLRRGIQTVIEDVLRRWEANKNKINKIEEWCAQRTRPVGIPEKETSSIVPAEKRQVVA